MNEDGGFLSRWSRRKAQVREGQDVPAEPPAAAVVPAVDAAPVAAAPPPVPAAPVAEPQPPAEPPPTLEQARSLTPASDFSRFVARDVDPAVKNTALKKLFADPQFNVMDGLDTYIDDYGQPDPIPASMLRKMVQSQVLGLFRDEEEAAAAPAAATPAKETPDEDAAVRLQPDDAAGRGDARAPEPGAGEDPGRLG
ncbi:DUF3306 domain-containing protein [Piscinibacter defluvii]|uniref:DUF3306 domain-containing protein n=1 Tax=Piscinibacter defluvii TaxID=1796922 RepID=UPI000FDD99A7|nr:DUF3306 domain-containing protein [Piscinibacter defluvii]